VPSLEERLAVLSPHLYDAVPLSVTAKQAGISARTAQRWLAGYRADGASALVRSGRADRGGWRIAAELVELIEGLALRRPAPQIAQVQANLDTRTVLPGDVEPTNEPIAILLDQGRSAKIRRSCRQRRRVARARRSSAGLPCITPPHPSDGRPRGRQLMPCRRSGRAMPPARGDRVGYGWEE